jgi:hypothetical protein
MGRLVEWNKRTLVPVRTTIRLARSGLDCSCTASCSITSMPSPTAVESLISMMVTDGRQLGVAVTVGMSGFFTVCGNPIDADTPLAA